MRLLFLSFQQLILDPRFPLSESGVLLLDIEPKILKLFLSVAFMFDLSFVNTFFRLNRE